MKLPYGFHSLSLLLRKKPISPIRQMLRESSENLAQALQSGDEEAFQLLFKQSYVSVCKTIQRFIKDKGIIEDLAQDIFVRLWEKREQLNITSSVGAYLHRMAINEALTYIRRQKKNNHTDIDNLHIKAPEHSTEEHMMGNELQDKISAAINTLPPRCQVVFRLSRFEKMSYKEIAAELDISIKTVENQMVKALKILRNLLQNYLPLLLVCTESLKWFEFI